MGPGRQSWPCVHPYTSPTPHLGTRQKSEKGVSADLGATDLRPLSSDHASEKSWFSVWKFLPLPFTSLSTSSAHHLSVHPSLHPGICPSPTYAFIHALTPPCIHLVSHPANFG